MKKEKNIPIELINNNENAIKITAQVFHCAAKKELSNARLRTMKTAVSKLFSAIFGFNFSNNSLIRDIIQSHNNKNPQKKEHLSLTWKLEDLISFLRMKPPPDRCSFKELTVLSIVHLMVFRGVRFAEIHRLSPLETSPTPDGWKFWLVIKNHRKKEPISIFPSDDKCLDTLSMLIELRNRIQNKIGDEISKHNTFWFREEGDALTPMSYNEIRMAAAQVLNEAGIKEYHLLL